MLIYLLHTVLDWFDDRFAHLGELIVFPQRVFDDRRALATYGHFPNWSSMFPLMIQGLTDVVQPAPAPP